MLAFLECSALIIDFCMSFDTVRTRLQVLHLLTGETGISVVSKLRKGKEASLESCERLMKEARRAKVCGHLC